MQPAPHSLTSTTTNCNAEADQNWQQKLELLRETFNSQKTRLYADRISILQQLQSFLLENKQEIVECLKKDLKCEYEAKFEVESCLSNIVYAMKHLQHWMRPSKKSTALAFKLDSAYVQPEPRGVVLIVGAWNYPLMLLIDPLIGAIAAGNVALLKPSEISQHTSRFVAAHINKHVSDCVCAVVCGDAAFSQRLLCDGKFDFIFFTGSVAVGRAVYEMAAKSLTPVCLELGGKSPCIVTSRATLKTAAQRIVWGKFFNCGQTCIAPDYVIFVGDAAAHSAFLAEIVAAIGRQFGDAQKSTCYSRIVSDAHFKRLITMLAEVPPAWIAAGGTHDIESRFVAPTVIAIPPAEAFTAEATLTLLQEEIFGPILPVLHVASVAEAVAMVRTKASPLALYAFSNDAQEVKTLLHATSSGSACVNDVLMQFSTETLPFGGVGSSGIGRYHGEYSFETFSNAKAVLHRTLLDERLNEQLRYAPIVEKRFSTLARVMFHSSTSLFERLLRRLKIK